MNPLERLARMHPLLELARPTQWIKNTLVLAPLLFGGRLFEPGPTFQVSLAFVAFCLASSAGYLWNDLGDVERDRAHPTKRLRPLPSGTVSPETARAWARALAFSALGLSLLLGGTLLTLVASYLAVTRAYSLWLRNVVIVDVMTIGLLFVLRVEGGSIAAGVVASEWLLISTGLLAVFLGVCKRRHELLLLGDDAARHREVLGDYGSQFLDAAISLLTSTALITFLLYATSPDTVARVGSTGMLLGGPFVLYGLLRYLQLIYTRDEGGNPTDVLLSDPGVIVAVLGFAVVAFGVQYF